MKKMLIFQRGLKYLSINKLNFLNTYENSSNKIYIEKVFSDKLYEVNKCIKLFLNEMKYIEDEEVEHSLNAYKYFFNGLLLTVNDYSEVFKNLDSDDLSEIREFSREFYQLTSYPDELEKSFNLLKELKNDRLENNLAKKLLEIIDKATSKEDIAIVCYKDSSKFREENSNKLTKKSITFYSSSQLLKESKIFEKLIFIGPPYLFRKYKNIFQGKKIHYIMYSFLGDFSFQQPVIKSNYKINSNIFKNVKIEKNSESNQLEYKIDLNEESKNKINKILNKHKVSENENQEKIAEGNLIKFLNNKYFIMPKNVKVRTIKLDVEELSENKFIVEKLKLNHLKKGDWILIKTDSDENLIKNEAKKIIGEHKYYHYLENIKLYKKALLEKSKRHKNLEEFIRELNKNNIHLKDVNTLKTWLTLETIKPKSLIEILNYLKFNDVSKNKIFNSAKEINKNHILAGKLILKKLTENIKNINYDDFVNEMSENKEYILETEDKGTFYIEEIENISYQMKEFMKKDMNRLF